ncbi:DNA-processing protein DprA [Vibrio sp. La 4.2.2]|uniref:DNA-processing protein DprA n=1 Tax=Vibrio sp. La 4.2.2 TaxID=2998830 RepID=UPI0022CDEABA|nr:DNA-processing protein DprA [Vibrio sp. La 4.2.2]MDA0111205.1 DNA-processing protein DprA [Vibrio sp. La 4.2.2]
MSDARTLAWLRLSLCPGIGAVTFEKLRAIDSPLNIVSYTPQELASIGLKPHQVAFIHHQSIALAEQALAWASGERRYIVISGDKAYPPLLSETNGAPPVLFVEGQLSLLAAPQIAMVGSRNATLEGLEIARSYASTFTKHDYCVTSGLALGIDGHAHQGALDAQGPTIAVLGSGLSQIYPARHKSLASRIAEHGALVSEHLPSVKPRAEHFPRRNRIVSGLSLAVLVVEATEKSGSLITAKYAAEQGRDVFAIPGSIRHPFHSGCHSLIKLGACLVQSPNDLLSEIESLTNWSKKVQPTLFDQVIDKEELPFPDLLANVGIEATPVDILAQKTHIPVQEVMQQLLELELLGHVVAVNGGYILKGRG